MGVAVGGICYSTQAEANDAYYSSQQVQVAPQDATHVVIVSNFKSGSIWNRLVDSYNVAGYSDSSNNVPLGNVGTSCTYINDPATQVTDGIAVGWLVVSAMVAAYAISLLRRAL